MEYYLCGKILTTHGIHGDLKVKSFSDFERFKKGARLYILHNGEYVMVKVCKVSDYNGCYLVRFEELEDINLVEKYHSDDIYISELDRNDSLDEGEYYYTDLIGKELINQNGEKRGIVKDIRELPQAKYLVVEYNGKNHLIPFINEFIGEVKDYIELKEIEGLLWK